MKFYTYGNIENPPIMLFPGTWCLHTSFNEVISLLQKSFYVIAVSYDGFDETEDSVFPNMITETEKIEAYIKENFTGRLFAAYGCSLGGSFVGLLVQRKNIHIEHGFIGSSDLDQSGKFKAWLITKLFGGMTVKMLQTGKYPWYMKKGFEKNLQTEYGRKFYEMLGIGKGGYPFIKKESAENQFYSDLITPLDEQISADGTTIHVFYAQKMGEKYLERYHKHFKNPHIVTHDLRHEELLLCYPEMWVEEIEKCCF